MVAVQVLERVCNDGEGQGEGEEREALKQCGRLQKC